MNTLEKDQIPNYFRANVGVVLVNENGMVFRGRRRGTKDSWQMPQGGIEKGENPETAARRELAEELGLGRSLLDRLIEKIGEYPAWIGYELPGHLWSKKHGRGQVQKWFFFKYSGSDRQIDSGIKQSVEFDDWSWIRFDELVSMVWETRQPVYTLLAKHFSDGLMDQPG